MAAGAWRRLAGQLGVEPGIVGLGRLDPAGPVPAEVTPHSLGRIYEGALAAADRHRGGVHYTPAGLAAGLVRAAWSEGVATVCDPAVGGGAFLLAAADQLAADGHDPAAIVGHQLAGLDVDPGALLVTEAALVGWAAGRGVAAVPTRLVEADALDGLATALGPFDLVVGNPPFQNQLGAGTARSTAATAGLRRRFGVAAGPYADTAAWFLLAGLDLVGDGGRVVLIQPHSTLGAASAAPIRAALAARAALVGLWWDGEAVFDASVRVWAPILRRGRGAAGVARFAGADVAPLDEVAAPEGATWSPVVADLLGVPAVDLRSAGGVLGDRASVTAGFRDEFYALAAAAREGDDGAPLVTVGMIEPAWCGWGAGGSYRLGGRRWERPVADVAAITEARVARWAAARLVPKVLVATQSKVIEAVVDPAGEWLPCTPVVSVEPDDPADIWPLAAVLLAPAVTAWALTRSVGTALAAGTIKLSARQVAAVPLPADDEAWVEGAAAARTAHATAYGPARRAALEALAHAMERAYASTPEVTAWWLARLR